MSFGRMNTRNCLAPCADKRPLVNYRNLKNITRTAVELMLAYISATNSCHSNSADEPFTTPNEEYVRIAAQAQAILLEETGLLKR
jgi:methylmalonyl-CoA mutase